MSVQINHPYVTQVEGIAGGKPVIRGTRTPVRSVVAYHQMGNTPEEIQVSSPIFPWPISTMLFPSTMITRRRLTPTSKRTGKSMSVALWTGDDPSTSMKRWMWRWSRPSVNVASTCSRHRKPANVGLRCDEIDSVLRRAGAPEASVHSARVVRAGITVSRPPGGPAEWPRPVLGIHP